MKTLLLAALLIPISLPAHAATGPKVVSATGSVPDSTPNSEEAAKEVAANDAASQCGGGPVEVADNLGWTIYHRNTPPPCRPNHYCDGLGDDTVSATALFVCLKNI